MKTLKAIGAAGRKGSGLRDLGSSMACTALTRLSVNK